MRVGLVSDIHANPIALEAVIGALDKAGVDRVICLGDVSSLGPDPRGTLARLRELRWPVVMGNMDAWALDPQPHPFRNDDTPYINTIELWNAAGLDVTDHATIRTFVPTFTLALGNGLSLLAYHGSPRSYYEAILPDTPNQQLAAIFAGEAATVLVGGHTHHQMARRWADKLIVNPGSVGAPIEYRRGAHTAYHPPWAEFAIVTAADGELSVDLRRTPVDVEALLVLAAAMQMPELDWWAAQWQR